MYARTIEDIDDDLKIECAVLAYEQRSGTLAAGFVAAWAKIDQLLDERMAVRDVWAGQRRAQPGPAV